jgi:hypothetical protein
MPNTEKIRALNDQLRMSLKGGRVAATPGVLALNDLPTILTQLQEYKDFKPGDDVYHEHDFGSFMHEKQLLFWKIDYYDSDLLLGSSDPSDPAVTARVLTIMCAEEY